MWRYVEVKQNSFGRIRAFNVLRNLRFPQEEDIACRVPQTYLTMKLSFLRASLRLVLKMD